jgi:hypothetical protein
VTEQRGILICEFRIAVVVARAGRAVARELRQPAVLLDCASEMLRLFGLVEIDGRDRNRQCLMTLLPITIDFGLTWNGTVVVSPAA